MKKNKEKKKKKTGKIIFIILLVIALCVGGYFVYEKYYKKDEPTVKIIKKITKYNYKLGDNKSKLYKKYFDELEDVLENEDVDYDEYAKVVSKLFITDFYTLNNKKSKNDIGGLDFIKDDMKDNFIDQARSTFYRYIKLDSNEDDLPEVSEVISVDVEKTTFTYSDGSTDENAYKVNITWEYNEDLGYEKEANMILVKDDIKLYIIEMD